MSAAIIAILAVTASAQDGLATWTLRKSPITSNLTGVAYGGGLFVAVADNGAVITSSDGSIWSAQNANTTNHLTMVRYVNGGFWAVGFGGTLVASSNGTDWVAQSSGVSGGLMDVAYGNGTYVAVGLSSGQGMPLTSPDGTNWISQVPSTTGQMYSVLFRGGQFVAPVYLEPSTQKSYLCGSADGVTWTNYAPNNIFLLTLAASPTVFAAIGNNFQAGTYPLMTSPDGNTWTMHTGGGMTQLVGIGYQQQFVAVGANGYILTSPNGNSWTRRTSPTTQFLQAIAFSPQTAVIVGANGTILQSGLLTPAAPTLMGNIEVDGFRLTLSGDPATQYRVQVSQDLFSWTDLGFIGDAKSGAFLLDTNAGPSPHFYRARWP